MPIYSYRCEKCRKIFDMLQKSETNGNVKCIYCDANAQKLFSPVGIIFKGSGFYSTDYKSGSSKAANNLINPKDDNKKTNIDKKDASAEKIKSADDKSK